MPHKIDPRAVASIAPLEANNAEVTFTEKRLAELRARLKALNKKSDADE